MTNSVLEEVRARLAQMKHLQTFLATLSDDGAPQVRPVTLMFYQSSFYFATARSSRKAQQIAKDQRVEFVTPFCEGGHSGYLRVQGHATEIRDLNLVETVTSTSNYPVREYWKGVADPEFYFFQVTPLRVEYMKPGNERAIEVTSEFLK